MGLTVCHILFGEAAVKNQQLMAAAEAGEAAFEAEFRAGSNLQGLLDAYAGAYHAVIYNAVAAKLLEKTGGGNDLSWVRDVILGALAKDTCHRVMPIVHLTPEEQLQREMEEVDSQHALTSELIEKFAVSQVLVRVPSSPSDSRRRCSCDACVRLPLPADANVHRLQAERGWSFVGGAAASALLGTGATGQVYQARDEAGFLMAVKTGVSAASRPITLCAVCI
jgi:hypothetical protein